MREVRRGIPEDIAALTDILWRGVHEGAAPRYTAEQRRAWLPERPTPEAFADRLAGQTIWVAEEAGRLTGFITLRDDGYLDFAYVLPEMRGTGTADSLLTVLENHAAARGLDRLTVRASDMARPFLVRRGWHVTAPEPQVREDVTMPATEMARDLDRN
ncbi:MAG: GNAT family N-acetyltransferase [Jannaschia sp.]